MNQSMKKIAIVHDWFTTPGGSENVLEQILLAFPDADLFSLMELLPDEERYLLHGTKVTTTFLQNAPFINHKNYRNYLPLMPLAIEQIDLSGYNVVLSNSHAVSKGVITGPEQLHICYIHNPLRYAWEMQNDYLKVSGFGGLKSGAARIFLHYLRSWDIIAASRPDILLANSGYIARRIQKLYRRTSSVLYPPVDTDYFTPNGSREDFYFTASRFVPYKRIELIAEAFRGLTNKKLVIIGDGPELPRIKSFIGENVTWLGYQPKDILRDHLRRCKAFIFAAKEDFGIIPVEAQACGAPVIAFGEGGAAETVLGQGSPNQTGLFFLQQSVEDLKAAVNAFEAMSPSISSQNCRSNAEYFSNQRFRKELTNIVDKEWQDFRKGW